MARVDHLFSTKLLQMLKNADENPLGFGKHLAAGIRWL